MPSLIAYLRASFDGTVYSLKLPEAPEGQQSGQELCTLPDGRTVVALFDGYTLPTDQPAEIAASIETLTLTDALKERITAASPYLTSINARLWQAAHDLEYAAISGSAIGLITMGVLQGKPKCLAVQNWIKSIWATYYERKAGTSTDCDFATVAGPCPHSVPELMVELGV